MHSEGKTQDSRLIAELNDLLQLDHDAVEAYTVAINLARDETIRETLVAYRADHKRHIEELAGLVRARGGLPTEMPHPTGVLKLAVQTLGAIPGDDSLLLAFKAVEGQARDKYRRFTRNEYPADVADVVRRAAQDEESHYAWVERTLRERGVGEGTLPHTLASVVERVHKLLANPLESAGRKVMETVGEMVGTTRTRGGSAAPSPADAAAGMAAHAHQRAEEADRSRPDTDAGMHGTPRASTAMGDAPTAARGGSGASHGGSAGILDDLNEGGRGTSGLVDELNDTSRRASHIVDEQGNPVRDSSGGINDPLRD